MTMVECRASLVALGFTENKPNPMNQFELTKDIGERWILSVWSRDGERVNVVRQESDDSAISILTDYRPQMILRTVAESLYYIGRLREIKESEPS